MKYLAIVFVSVSLATGCASGPAETGSTQDGSQQPIERESNISPEKRAELEPKFCQATLDYLSDKTDRQVPAKCEGVIMRETEQFGHGEHQGYLVTVILGQERDKIELGAVVSPDGEVQLESLQQDLDRAAVQQARLDIRQLSNQVDTFYLEASPKRLPESLSELGADVPKDPWGNDYMYKKKSSTDYVIFSVGPDGQAGTLDDVYVE